MIAICLPSGDRHGWGILGTRLRQYLSKLTTVVDASTISVATDYDMPVLVAINGPDFSPMNKEVRGIANIGIGFIESPSIAKQYLANAEQYYDVIICGSTWMAERLRMMGIENTTVALQGVDYDLFKPAEEDSTDTPFTIFSGGKFEYRKGQDIVLQTFKVFQQRHKEAQLIASWGNLWPSTMASMERSSYIKYRQLNVPGWKTNVLNALYDNNIPMQNVVIPEMCKNPDMVELYHRAHVGLFPNRAEAGANLVLCEAVASGLPVIASYATGHIDVMKHGIGIPLNFARIEGDENGWYDANGIDEILSYLEYAYTNANALEQKGIEDSKKIRTILSWEKFAQDILSTCSQVSA
jgi:glycosyltransferase involved in cell wall biosynthesis